MHVHPLQSRHFLLSYLHYSEHRQKERLVLLNPLHCEGDDEGSAILTGTHSLPSGTNESAVHEVFIFCVCAHFPLSFIATVVNISPVNTVVQQMRMATSIQCIIFLMIITHSNIKVHVHQLLAVQLPFSWYAEKFHPLYSNLSGLAYHQQNRASVLPRHSVHARVVRNP